MDGQGHGNPLNQAYPFLLGLKKEEEKKEESMKVPKT